MIEVTPRRGRPRKFMVPARAVTLTLPESVIAALEAVDHDLSRAVVRVAQSEMTRAPHAAADLSVFGRWAVIVVNPTRTLEQRTGVMLVPLSDGRALIAFDESMTPARLELKIQDEIDAQKLPDEDARVFESIRDLLRDARRSSSIALRQKHIIVLERLGRTGEVHTRTRRHRNQTE